MFLAAKWSESELHRGKVNRNEKGWEIEHSSQFVVACTRFKCALASLFICIYLEGH